MRAAQTTPEKGSRGERGLGGPVGFFVGVGGRRRVGSRKSRRLSIWGRKI
jgi:hypothetical protein